MKTTVRIDPDLFADLKAQAQESGESFRKVLNRTLRKGIRSGAAPRRAAYRCPVFALGQPSATSRAWSMDKALALASDIEDAEVMGELERRK